MKTEQWRPLCLEGASRDQCGDSPLALSAVLQELQAGRTEPCEAHPTGATRFGVLSYDDARDILELRWLPETEAMTDNDFMRWLERFAAAAEEHRAPFLLIDTRAFQHHAGTHVWPWRDEHILPRYNQAGVKKFAFLLPTGASPKTEPTPEGRARFPTGYFDSREQIDLWFTS